MPSEMPSFPFRSQCTNNHIKTNKTNHTGIIVHLFYRTMLSPEVQFAIQQKKIVTLCFCAFQATCTNTYRYFLPIERVRGHGWYGPPPPSIFFGRLGKDHGNRNHIHIRHLAPATQVACSPHNKALLSPATSIPTCRDRPCAACAPSQRGNRNMHH